MEAYKNSFLIDHQLNLNLILTLARKSNKNLNKNLNIRNLRSHIHELKKKIIFSQYFIDAETNAKNTRDTFTNKERVDSSIEIQNVKRM